MLVRRPAPSVRIHMLGLWKGLGMLWRPMLLRHGMGLLLHRMGLHGVR